MVSLEFTESMPALSPNDVIFMLDDGTELLPFASLYVNVFQYIVTVTSSLFPPHAPADVKVYVEFNISGTIVMSPSWHMYYLPMSVFPVMSAVDPQNVTLGAVKTVSLTGTNFIAPIYCFWWINCGGGAGGSIREYIGMVTSPSHAICPVPPCACAASPGYNYVMIEREMSFYGKTENVTGLTQNLEPVYFTPFQAHCCTDPGSLPCPTRGLRG